MIATFYAMFLALFSEPNNLTFAIGSNYQGQIYYGLLVYLVLAALICALLASLAYILSLSTTQDSEKRGEYECGFEPFDSATRLPFDVHFYLVGILFLIFDVEIALLVPWTLGLRSCGWFGFYLIVGFVALLGVGFLYEWKRGALIWPSRQRELPYSAGLLLVSQAISTPAVDSTLLELTEVNLFLASSEAFETVPLLPETILLGSIVGLLCYVSLLLHRRIDKKAIALLTFKIASSILFIVAILFIIQYCALDEVLFIYSGYFVISKFTLALKTLLILIALFVFSNSRAYIEGHRQHHLEYSIIFLLSTLLMLILVASNHLFVSFLSLVGFSLNMYVLIMFDPTSSGAREAGIKYYFLSTFSSGLLLYGLFLLYTMAKTGRYDLIGPSLSASYDVIASSGSIHFAVLFILLGLFFKLSAFPGHLWAAEVYSGSPSPIMAYFIVPVKLAVLGFVIPLLTFSLEPVVSQWQSMLAVAAIASMVWGALGAFFEKQTKRFLAYASINQIGFILIGLTTGTEAGYKATFLYVTIYTLMNVILIGVFLNARHNDGRDLNFLTDFSGLKNKNKIASWALTLSLFSMAGIPPLAGFYGKYYLLFHAFEQGLYGLVIVGLATSLISTYYYLRLIKIIWFEGVLTQPIKLFVSDRTATIMYLSAFALLGFFIFQPFVFELLDSLVVVSNLDENFITFMILAAPFKAAAKKVRCLSTQAAQTAKKSALHLFMWLVLIGCFLGALGFIWWVVSTLPYLPEDGYLYTAQWELVDMWEDRWVIWGFIWPLLLLVAVGRYIGRKIMREKWVAWAIKNLAQIEHIAKQIDKTTPVGSSLLVSSFSRASQAKQALSFYRRWLQPILIAWKVQRMRAYRAYTQFGLKLLAFYLSVPVFYFFFVTGLFFSSKVNPGLWYKNHFDLVSAQIIVFFPLVCLLALIVFLRREETVNKYRYEWGFWLISMLCGLVAFFPYFYVYFTPI